MYEKWVENYPLFKECLEALNVNLLPESESEKLLKIFKQTIPITKWGKVDWDKIDKKKYVGNNPQQVISSLNELLKDTVEDEVYIAWSSASFPVIRADLNKVIFFDDVSCVSIEKFIFNLSQGYIVEVRAGDEITVGLLPWNFHD